MKMLKAARKRAGLTMKELGQKVGVSESAISQYENGRREADFETLLKISEALNCSIDYLLRGDDNPNLILRDLQIFAEAPPLDAQEQELVTKFRCLDDRGQAAVMNVVNYEYSALPGEKTDSVPQQA